MRGNGYEADAGEGDGLIFVGTGDEFPGKSLVKERWVAGFMFS